MITRFFLWALFGCSVMVACAPNVNLSAVQQYATMAQQAQASFDAIAEDYDASCARQRELNLRIGDLVWIPYPATQAPPTTPAPAGARAGKASSAPFFGDASQERCVVTADYAAYPLGEVSREWQKANDTLLAYIQSLGALAGAAPTPSPAIPTFVGAAAAAKLIPNPQATAITQFATAIFNYWQTSEREHAVAKFLDETNSVDPATQQSPFSEAIEALTVAGSGYEIVVYNECTDVNNLYIDALTNLGSMSRKGREQFTIERAYQVRQRWSADASTCNTHFAAAQAYLTTIQKISTTNSALYKAMKEPASSKDALEHDISDLSGTISALYTLVTTKATPSPKPAPTKTKSG